MEAGKEGGKLESVAEKETEAGALEGQEMTDAHEDYLTEDVGDVWRRTWEHQWLAWRMSYRRLTVSEVLLIHIICAVEIELLNKLLYFMFLLFYSIFCFSIVYSRINT